MSSMYMKYRTFVEPPHHTPRKQARTNRQQTGAGQASRRDVSCMGSRQLLDGRRGAESRGWPSRTVPTTACRATADQGWAW